MENLIECPYMVIDVNGPVVSQGLTLIGALLCFVTLAIVFIINYHTPK